MALRKIIVVKEPFSVQTRMAELGVVQDDLIAAVTRFAAAEASATTFHPQNARGLLAWIAGSGELRERLTAKGWTISNEGGSAAIVRADGGIRIIVSSGDGQTGSPDENARPSTMNPKGPVTGDSVRRNGSQMNFDIRLPTFPTAKVVSISAATERVWLYILLIHCTDDVIKWELSCPESLVNGHVCDWAERIVPAPIKREPSQNGGRKYDDPDEGVGFDVPVNEK